jgi:hypothetical protein
LVSKEDFNKVWKDSTREAILNQFYYDYIELRKVYSIIKEAREYINSNEFIGRIRLSSDNKQAINKLLEILDKVGENKWQ